MVYSFDNNCTSNDDNLRENSQKDKYKLISGSQKKTFLSENVRARVQILKV